VEVVEETAPAQELNRMRRCSHGEHLPIVALLTVEKAHFSKCARSGAPSAPKGAFLALPKNACLQFLAQEFENDVAEERGYHCDGKIGGGKNIFHCPGQAVLLSNA
jgi:hypothetical protein